ncbi:HALOACID DEHALOGENASE-LIKE HYDROLASE [Salix purpurea]|uniref:HALOACID DEHALOGENASE-LIKE HYDROLASE n=1 Tax=Salix purpurea TaxID=77065 RepID=A0A9Q0PNY1_SALPP|nr:HALOACID DEHALOGENASE-LIKE HYDROLASE [Salix purpurea]
MACEDQCRQGLKPKYDCLLFDVDDTLYPRSSGLLEEVTENIQEYMVQKLGVEETEASQINGVLYKSYGTSMAGLKAIGYDFDNDDYHRFVHGRLPYERLKPDNVLRSLLLSLPIRKVIFSNADKAHVAKVLSRLGLEDCFDGVICFETLNPCNYEGINSSDENGVRRPSYTSRRQILDIIEHPCQSDSVPVLQETPVVCKPFEDAFEQAFKLANINPRKTVFFDDSVRNIKTGKLMGLHTVLVGTASRINGADYALESIHNMKEALSDLWEAEDKTEARSFAGKVSMETTVTA